MGMSMATTSTGSATTAWILAQKAGWGVEPGPPHNTAIHPRLQPSTPAAPSGIGQGLAGNHGSDAGEPTGKIQPVRSGASADHVLDGGHGETDPGRGANPFRDPGRKNGREQV